MIRAAVVGLGWWGRVHVDSVQGKSDAIRFVAGCSLNRDKDETFCRERGLEFIPDSADVLARKDIDAIVLATPNSMHSEQIVRVAGAGKHIFVEKPFTLDLASGKRAVEAAMAAGVTLAVGLNRRFRPSMDSLRASLKAGRVGDISMISCEQTSPEMLLPAISSWRSDPKECPAGALAPVGVHSLDAMIEIGGAVREVHAISARRVSQALDDTTCVLLSFENGIIGQLYCSLATASSYRMAIFGNRGIAEIFRSGAATGPELFRLTSAPERTRDDAKPQETLETPPLDTVGVELNAFAEAAAGGAPYPIPLDEVLKTVAAFEAIVISAETGRAVKVG